MAVNNKIDNVESYVDGYISAVQDLGLAIFPDGPEGKPVSSEAHLRACFAKAYSDCREMINILKRQIILLDANK